MACIYIDYDDTATGMSSPPRIHCSGLMYLLRVSIFRLEYRWGVAKWFLERLIKERVQPATSPKVEELHLLHYDTGSVYPTLLRKRS
jgi:hypothetical protein